MYNVDGSIKVTFHFFSSLAHFLHSVAQVCKCDIKILRNIKYFFLLSRVPFLEQKTNLANISPQLNIRNWCDNLRHCSVVNVIMPHTRSTWWHFLGSSWRISYNFRQLGQELVWHSYINPTSGAPGSWHMAPGTWHLKRDRLHAPVRLLNDLW